MGAEGGGAPPLLAFQEEGGFSSGAGAGAGAGAPPHPPPLGEAAGGGGAGAPGAPALGFGAKLVARFRPYFDVDTGDVGARVGMAAAGPAWGLRQRYRGASGAGDAGGDWGELGGGEVAPAGPAGFLQGLQDKPDLYGPFWVTTTLIFVTAVAGNFADYLQAPNDVRWANDIDKVSYSAILFYGYATVVPTVLHWVLRTRGAVVPLLSLICLYGYSLSLYIPTAVLCMVPNPGWRWFVVMLAGLFTSSFVVLNLRLPLETAFPGKGALASGALGLVNFSIAIGLKLYFFKY